MRILVLLDGKEEEARMEKKSKIKRGMSARARGRRESLRGLREEPYFDLKTLMFVMEVEWHGTVFMEERNDHRMMMEMMTMFLEELYGKRFSNFFFL